MAQSVLRDNAQAYVAGVKALQRPTSQHEVQQAELEHLYRFNWVCRNVCDLYAKDMTSQGVEWLCDPELADLLERSFRRLRIWPQLSNAIKWARLYGGSIILLNMADGRTDAPLNPAAGLDGLMVFDRYEVTPDTQHLLTGVHYGEPASYQVTPRVLAQGFTADASRVIRFTGNSLPDSLLQNNSLWGDSVVQAMVDRVKYFNSATDSTAELMKRSYLRFLGIKDFWQAMCSDDDADAQNIAKAVDMINLMQTISGLTVADKEDTFSSQTYSFGGVKDVLDQFGQQIAGATGIPLVRLFGMSPSGFSTGDADLKNYYGSIMSVQEETLREPIERIARVILEAEGYSDADLDFHFVGLNQPTQAERMQAGQIATSTILSALSAGVISPEIALAELKRQSEYSGIFSTVTQADIDALKLPEVPGAPEYSEGENELANELAPEQESETEATQEPQENAAI